MQVNSSSLHWFTQAIRFGFVDLLVVVLVVGVVVLGPGVVVLGFVVLVVVELGVVVVVVVALGVEAVVVVLLGTSGETGTTMVVGELDTAVVNSSISATMAY